MKPVIYEAYEGLLAVAFIPEYLSATYYEAIENDYEDEKVEAFINSEILDKLHTFTGFVYIYDMPDLRTYNYLFDKWNKPNALTVEQCLESSKWANISYVAKWEKYLDSVPFNESVSFELWYKHHIRQKVKRMSGKRSRSVKVRSHLRAI